MKLWKLPEGSLRFDLRGHSNRVYSVAFSHDGRHLATGGGDGMVILWDVAQGRILRTLPSYHAVRCVAFSPDDRLLATTARHVTRIWDAETWTLQAVLGAHSDRLWCVRWSPDQRWMITAAADGMVRVWRTADLQDYTSMTLETVGDVQVWSGIAWPGRYALAPQSGCLATGTSAGQIHLRQLSAPGKKLRLPGEFRIRSHVAFSADGRTLAAVEQDENVSLWHAPEFNRGSILVRDAARRALFPAVVIKSLSMSADGTLLALADSEGRVEVWDAVARRETVCIHDPADPVRSVACDPAGRFVALGYEDCVRLWDVERRESPAVLENARAPDSYLCFSNDGGYLAAAGEHRWVYLWRLSGATPTEQALVHSSPVACVAFSSDGQTLAAAGADGTIKLWDTASGQDTLTLKVPGVPWGWVGFSDHPPMLVAATVPVDNRRRLFAWSLASPNLDEPTANEELSGATGTEHPRSRFPASDS